jgi:uncharacterized protein involved in response to NO
LSAHTHSRSPRSPRLLGINHLRAQSTGTAFALLVAVTPSVTATGAKEAALSRLLSAYIIAGLLFMLLPGTFLGVWNLISISSDHSVSTLSPAWIQAHGHAQIFGWIGTFIIGIGYFSLSKMGAISSFAVSRGWASWALWVAGVSLRWTANVSLWHWRILLPASGLLELAAFLIFYFTVSRHKSTGARRRLETWMLLVIGSTVGFLLLLLFNSAVSFWIAFTAAAPEIPHGLDQRFLVLATWGVPVLAVWGFNARWLPAFMGLKRSSEKGLRAALLLCAIGVMAALCGYFPLAGVALLIASVTAALAINIFDAPEKQPLLEGAHSSYPAFIRICYVWLGIASVLSLWASVGDHSGGIWGASRHALTVGFLAAMIFAIAPRILPAFCGGKQLFSPRVMMLSSALLNVGCLLRVGSEIPAYEGYSTFAWHVLPCSAVVELIAVSLFALNLALTMMRVPKPVIDNKFYQISLTPSTKQI